MNEADELAAGENALDPTESRRIAQMIDLYSYLAPLPFASGVNFVVRVVHVIFEYEQKGDEHSNIIAYERYYNNIMLLGY